jgi:hypothetical protein
MGLSGKGTSRPNENIKIKKKIVDRHSEQLRIDETHNSVPTELYIWYTNADSLLNKRGELESRLSVTDNKPHVIAITEIKPKKLSTKLMPSEFNLEGYALFISNDLDNNLERGIIIYVRSNLVGLTSAITIPVDFCEGLFVSIKLLNSIRLIIGTVYRSPSSSISNDAKLNEAISYICNKFSDPILLVGDFNYGSIDWNNAYITDDLTHKQEFLFLQTIRDCFLKQHVTKPTRQRGSDNPHTLDLVITNGPFISHIDYESPLGHSDHSTLILNCSLETEIPRNEVKFIFNKGNYEELRRHVRRNWNTELNGIDDVDDMWNTFKSIIKEGMVKHIPKRYPNVHSFKSGSRRIQPFSDNIKNLVKKKHRTWNRVIETRTATAEIRYKKIRNKVRAETRKLVAAEQADIARSCKSNPKSFWKFVRSRTNYRSGIGDLQFTDSNGIKTLVNTDKDKADALVNFFSEVFTKEDNEVIEDIKPHISINPMEEFIFNELEIMFKLKMLKVDKSPGLDGLHPRVLREIREEISFALQIIFEKSLALGELPVDWKNGVVTAIYKKGVKSDMGNYRPVSLTSIVCKVMESLIRDHIMSHCIKYKLFSNKQYGFLKGRSTAIQLLHMLDKWTEFLETQIWISQSYS